MSGLSRRKLITTGTRRRGGRNRPGRSPRAWRKSMDWSRPITAESTASAKL